MGNIRYVFLSVIQYMNLQGSFFFNKVSVRGLGVGLPTSPLTQGQGQGQGQRQVPLLLLVAWACP